jgi:hypothetical protein|tara:strand:- start:199 stop:411 length:213 start_codon:yes stop_codon:yes gene_type:complete
MSFLSFIVLVVIAYLLWRISDQLPDVLYRLGEIQKDIAALNRRGAEASTETTEATKKPAPKKKPQTDSEA